MDPPDSDHGAVKLGLARQRARSIIPTQNHHGPARLTDLFSLSLPNMVSISSRLCAFTRYSTPGLLIAAAPNAAGCPVLVGMAPGERVHARLAVGCCADGRRDRARRITTGACANGARYVRGQRAAYPDHGRGTDPILLAVAHGGLALASRDPVSTAKADLERPNDRGQRGSDDSSQVARARGRLRGARRRRSGTPSPKRQGSGAGHARFPVRSRERRSPVRRQLSCRRP
jgi:hypothetical protein